MPALLSFLYHEETANEQKVMHDLLLIADRKRYYSFVKNGKGEINTKQYGIPVIYTPLGVMIN